MNSCSAIGNIHAGSRRILAALSACALLGSLMANADEPGAPATGEVAPAVRFRWAVGAYEHGGDQLIPIRNSATLSTNAAIAMYLSPESPCFIYVLIETGDGDYEWHFPGQSPADAENFQAQTAYYIPPPPMGLRVISTNGANAKIHVFASATRLKDLETQFARYARASGREKDVCASDLAALLDQLKRKGATGAAPTPEDDALALRSDNSTPRGTDLNSLASRITAPNFFARTIILRCR